MAAKAAELWRRMGKPAAMCSGEPGAEPPAAEPPPPQDPPLSRLCPGAVSTLSERRRCPKAADTRR